MALSTIKDRQVMGKDRCHRIAARPEDKYGNNMQILHKTSVRNKRIMEESARFSVYMVGIIFINVPMSGTFPTPALFSNPHLPTWFPSCEESEEWVQGIGAERKKERGVRLRQST